MRALEVWYSRVDASEIIALSNGRRRRAVNDYLARAQHHTNLDALPRLTEPAGDGRRFLEDPPLLTHAEECHPGWVEEIMARYRASLSDERRQLLSRFRHPGRRVVNRPGRPGPLRPAVRLGPARTHARSGDGVTISGYLGTGDRFDRAVADFAEAYADQTEADYAAFTRAQGSAPAERGRGGGTNQRKGDGG